MLIRLLHLSLHVLGTGDDQSTRCGYLLDKTLDLRYQACYLRLDLLLQRLPNI